MTTTVSETTQAVVSGGPLDDLSTTLGIIVISLLMTLLVQKELFRVEGGARWKHTAHVLDSAIVPLAAAAGLIVTYRILEITNVL